MTNLMDHALNIFGATTGGTFRPNDVKAGAPIKLVQWDGCMATERNEVDEGRVVRHAPSPHNNGKYPGIVVAWSKRGQRWEPLDYVRRAGGKWEVWK
jgi:hypothetical protein